MTKALLALSRHIDALSALVGHHVRWLILAAILVSAANAILRKVFAIGSNGWLELQWLLFAASFMLAGADTFRKNAHVRIDVLSSRFSKRTRDVIELLGHFFLLAPFSVVLLVLSWPYFVDSWQQGEVSSNAGGLPVWPAKFLIFAGMLLLVLQMVSEVIKRSAVLAGIMDEAAPQPVNGRSPSGAGPSGGHVE